MTDLDEYKTNQIKALKSAYEKLNKHKSVEQKKYK